MNFKKNKKDSLSDFLSKFKKESEAVYRLKCQSFDFEETISNLVKTSKVNELKNVRICIHSKDTSKIQYMIIFHSSDYKVPIHRHSSKSEFLKIHKGSCTYKSYSFAKGKFILQNEIKLFVNSVIIVPKNQWHN